MRRKTRNVIDPSYMYQAERTCMRRKAERESEESLWEGNPENQSKAGTSGRMPAPSTQAGRLA